MDWFIKICDRIRERKSITSINSDYEIGVFIENIRVSKELLEKTQTFEDYIRSFIYKSIVVKLVSTFEGFLKFYFEKMIKDWDFPLGKLIDKIDKKLKLSDLLHFQDKEIHISELVAELFNFQNLKDIDKIFRNLLDLDKNIFEILYDFYYRNLKPGAERVEEIYPKLKEIIELRHFIVHDIIHESNIEKEALLDYLSFLQNIMVGFSDLIAENLMEKNNERGMMYLGFLKWDLKEYDAAIKCFEKTLEFEPEFPGYHFSLGILYQEQENFSKSIEHLRFFVEKEPEAYDGWFYLGEFLLSVEDYEGSLEAYTKALEIKPNDIECLNSIAFNYYNLDRNEAALKEVKKVLEVDNENFVSYWLLGTINFEMENYKDALEAFNKGLEIEPYDVCFGCYKGRTLVELNENKEAIIILTKTISLKPIEICIFKHLAKAYLMKGDINKSISILKEGLELAKQNNDQDEIIIIQEELDILNSNKN